MNNIDTFRDKTLTAQSLTDFQSYVVETYGSGAGFADYWSTPILESTF